MGANNDENNKKESLKDKLKAEIESVRFRDRMDEIRRKEDLKIKQSQRELGKKYEKKDKETNENLAKIKDHIKSEQQGQHHKQIDLYSAMMDAMPRLESLFRFIMGKTHATIGRPVAGLVKQIPFFGSYSHRSETVQRMLETFSKKEEFDIPDLAYFVGVDEDGSLVMDWDDIPQLQGQHGPLAIANNPTFQNYIQDAITEWLDTSFKDEYFMGPVEVDGKVRMYPKSVGVEAGGGVWILDPKEVNDRYESTDCVEHAGWLMPKPNSSPKPGKKPLFVNEEEFVKLRDKATNPGKSLEEFLEYHFDGLAVEPSSAPRMGG